MTEYIYYTGIGAKKNGKHTIKEFLEVMNKNFNIECSEYLSKNDYNPCSEYNDMVIKKIKYNIKNNKPPFTPLKI